MSDDQLTDLKKYLDGRFDEQGQRLEAHLDARLAEQDEKLDKRFAEQDEKFDKNLNLALAKFAGQVNHRFAEVEASLATKADKQDLDRIYNALDAILKNQEIEQHERVAIIAQLNRHERWHHQTADKLGLKLEYQEP